MNSKDFQIGLKLWSTNTSKISDAIKLYKSGFYQYIELYSVPNSYISTISKWINCKVPFVIHAPHFMSGMDLSNSSMMLSNQILINEAISFANALSATDIIFHPGVKGSLKETAHQLSNIHDDRIVIENVPSIGVDENLHLLGSKPDEIEFLLTSVDKLRFCLDIVHAVCAANTARADYMAYIRKFIELDPQIIHLADNSINNETDKHLPLGEGSIPVKIILNILPPKLKVTLESNINTSDFYNKAYQEAKIFYE